MADDEVVSAGPAQGFGLWVRIRHDDDTVTVYGHTNDNLVSVGQRVNAGQRIATVGNRRNSTAPHLHFEVELPAGTKVDPARWLTSRKRRSWARTTQDAGPAAAASPRNE